MGNHQCGAVAAKAKIIEQIDALRRNIAGRGRAQAKAAIEGGICTNQLSLLQATTEEHQLNNSAGTQGVANQRRDGPYRRAACANQIGRAHV